MKKRQQIVSHHTHQPDSWQLAHVTRVLKRSLKSPADRDREIRERLRNAAIVAAETRNTETAMAGSQPLSAVLRIAKRVMTRLPDSHPERT